MSELPQSSILLPLYIYPDPGKWDRLFKAIEAYPKLDFVVIVNPNSGPGREPWWPNADYVREIPRLNAYQNVRTVGYVYTRYCKRDMEDSLEDIKKYAEWSRDEKQSGLGVSGIFFDETPNLYADDVKTYLDAVTTRVKETNGILKNRLVIHNPGTAVQRALATPGPNITTVAETAHCNFQKTEYQKWLATSPYDRSRTSYMVHSVPEDEVSGLVRKLRKKAAYLFITDLEIDFYHSFGQSWEQFVAAMAE